MSVGMPVIVVVNLCGDFMGHFVRIFVWTCCCGLHVGNIDFEHVAVAYILVTSSLNMFLWLALCAFHAFRTLFVLITATPHHHKLEHVPVANVLVTSSLNMLLWLMLCAFHTFR